MALHVPVSSKTMQVYECSLPMGGRSPVISCWTLTAFTPPFARNCLEQQSHDTLDIPRGAVSLLRHLNTGTSRWRPRQWVMEGALALFHSRKDASTGLRP